MVVDEAQRHDRYAKEALGEARDAIECFFGRRVEHIVSQQCGKPLPLACAAVGIRH